MDYQKNYYAILGLNASADVVEIRQAFHKLAFKYHPDYNPENKEAATQFRAVHEAYKILSDPDLRNQYDRRISFSAYSTALVPYLDVSVDCYKVKQFEEIELIYRFGSDGRGFKKPDLKGWNIAAGPLVDHQEVVRNGKQNRETILHYTICPAITGKLIISAARVRYDDRTVLSPTIELEVESNRCAFNNKDIAGSRPLIVPLYREFVREHVHYRKTVVQRRKVYIPRGDLAAWYHQIGHTLKISFTITGMAVASLNDFNMIGGALAGSLFAGLNIMFMYKVMGIRPQWKMMRDYAGIKDYFDLGYRYGNQPDPFFPGTRLRMTLYRFFV